LAKRFGLVAHASNLKRFIEFAYRSIERVFSWKQTTKSPPMNHPIRQLLIALAVLGAARPIHAASFSPEAASPAKYDVAWNSPSKDQNG
jgi:hypothetical protein